MTSVHTLLAGSKAGQWQNALSAAGFAVEVARDEDPLDERITQMGSEVVVLGPDPDPGTITRLRSALPSVSIIAVADRSQVGALLVAGSDEVLREPVSCGQILMAALRSAERRRLMQVAGTSWTKETLRVLDSLARSADQEGLTEAFLRTVAGILSSRFARLLVVPEHARRSGDLELAGDLTADSIDLTGRVSEGDQRVYEWVALERRGLIVNRDVDADREESLLCAPLVTATRLVGVLAISDSDRNYRQDELEFLNSISSVVAAALDRVLLVERICAANAEWRAAFDAHVHPIALIAPDLTINRVNVGFADAAGSSPARLVGKPLRDVLSLDTALEGSIRRALEHTEVRKSLVVDPFGSGDRVEVEIFPRYAGDAATAATIVVRRPGGSQ